LKQLPEFKAYIAATFDVCLICDELEIEPEELLDAFEKRLIEKQHRFLEEFEEREWNT
jgi:hypothetical protein|tara:strand:+ start:1493 stop:1666 length:174 start_codon:yes stop_codon:yes gene_type:complete